MCIKVGQEVYFKWASNHRFFRKGTVIKISNLNYTLSYPKWLGNYVFTRKGVSPIITLCA